MAIVTIVGGLIAIGFYGYVAYLLAEILKKHFFDKAETKLGNAALWVLSFLLCIPLAVVVLLVINGCNRY